MKIGILGHGSIGKRHATNAKTLGHKVLVYDAMGRKDVPSQEHMLDECDAIVIATPPMYHKSGMKACLDAGRHMFVEKPIAMNDLGITELLQQADAKKLVHFMGNNLRFHPCINEAKAMIAQRALGTLRWAHFTCAQKNTKYSEDVAINWGAHEVDMGIYLLGPVTNVISAVGDGKAIDFMLDHGSCRATYHLDYVTPTEIRESWIVGDKDRLGLELLGRSIILGTVPQTFTGTYDDDYFDEMSDFIARINGEGMTRGATGHDGLATLKVLLEVRNMAGLA